MIIGAEVALLFLGLYALIAGKLPTGKKAKHEVRGWPARVVGIICLLPLPLSFLVGSIVAVLMVAQGKEVTRESFFWLGTAIEGSIVLACAVTAGVLARVYRTPVEQTPADDARA
jgi:hypothetical protein